MATKMLWMKISCMVLLFWRIGEQECCPQHDWLNDKSRGHSAWPMPSCPAKTQGDFWRSDSRMAFLLRQVIGKFDPIAATVLGFEQGSVSLFD